MNLEEITEYLSMLESETPTSHFGWLRLRSDAMTCLVWMERYVAQTDPYAGTWSYYDRIHRIIAKADEAISKKAASRLSGLCLNPSH